LPDRTPRLAPGRFFLIEDESMPDPYPCSKVHATAAVRPWKQLAAALLVTAAAQAMAQEEAPRNTVCQAVRGMLVPVCNAAICNQGKVTGDLQGRYTSRVTSIYPAGSGWLSTSWTRIELDGGKGQIDTVNQGTMPFDSQRGPDQSVSTEVLHVSEARGAYQDHTGTLVLVGAHQLGKATPYAGRLCHTMGPAGPAQH
jgi:hypothetical protein